MLEMFSAKYFSSLGLKEQHGISALQQSVRSLSALIAFVLSPMINIPRHVVLATHSLLGFRRVTIGHTVADLAESQRERATRI